MVAVVQLLLLRLLDVLADALAQRVHRLEALADGLRELFVELGQHLFLRLDDGHGEVRLLAGELLAVDVLRHGQVELHASHPSRAR